MSNPNSNTCAGINGTTFNMKDFDALPREVREALANSNQNWNCTQLREAMTGRLKGTKRRKYPAEYILNKIAENDAKLAASHYALLESGEPLPRYR